MIAYTVIFSYFTILKHFAFRSGAWDLSCYEQCLWSAINTPKPFSYTVEPFRGHYFAMHFCPILFLILPIYALHQTNETLLVLQSAVLALGALPLYWLTRDELKGRGIPALAVALSYLLYTPLHSINWWDFHIEAFVPALYLFMFYYFRRRELLKSFLFFTLTLMTIEFASAMGLFFGVYGLIIVLSEYRRSKKSIMKRILYPCGVIALSIAWYFIATEVMEALNPGSTGIFFGMYWGRDWGGNAVEIVVNVVTHPIQAWKYMLNSPDKIRYLLWLFSPVLFIPLFHAPLELLFIAGPWLFASLLAHFIWFYDGQYPGYVVAQVFIATVCGLRNLSARGISVKKIVGSLLAIALPSSVLLSPLGLGLYPHPGFSWRVERPKIGPHELALSEIVKLVPRDANVATLNHIFPHLCHNLNARTYPEPSTDYILTDGYSWFPDYPTEVWCSSAGLVSPDEYGVLAAVDGIVLLKKGYRGPVVYRPSKVKHALVMRIYNDTRPEDMPVIEMLKFDPNWYLEHWPPVPLVGIPLPGEYIGRWCITYEGYLHAPEPGAYAFAVKSDDGSSLYIDDKAIIEGHPGPPIDESATVWLEEGYHEIYIVWAQITGPAFFELKWKPPWADLYRHIPSKYFFT